MPLKTMRGDDPSINLTPMIDIVFLLIIFFMVGSRFTELNDQERDVSVKVPQVAPMPTSAQTAKKRVINVLQDRSIRIDGEPCSLSQLEHQLRSGVSENARTAVVVRGDSQTNYQAVADVIAICRRAAIQDISLAVRVAEKDP